MRSNRLFLFSVFICCSVHSEIPDKPLVKVKQGTVKGKLMTSVLGKTFNAFLGIPYGKVVRRFTNPIPAAPWTGVYDATQDANVCMQFNVARQMVLGEEDCLHLNVYTPRLPSLKGFKNNSLPVLVFLHGGNFVFGDATSKSFGSERLMDYPIILVTIYYRLGSLGFLSTNDEASLGNYGLLDQVLAFKWIKDNIKHFGGDSNRVTISGQSAGAKSVILHLLSPMSKGLFHATIAESGSVPNEIALQLDPLGITQKLASKVNCTTNDNQAMVDCLRNVDATELLNAEKKSYVSFIVNHTNIHAPVIEDPKKGGRFLLDSPLKLLKYKKFQNVPNLSGIMALEQGDKMLALEQAGLLPDVTDINDPNLEIIINNIIDIDQPNRNYAIDPAEVKQEYFKNVNFSNSAAVKLREVQLSSDFRYISPTEKAVQLLSVGSAPVYAYKFVYSFKELAKTNYSGKPDATHLQDLIYLFKRSNNGELENNSTEVQEKIHQVLNWWTNFVIYGNPSPNGCGPINWTPVKPGKMQYLNIDTNLTMVHGSYSDKMQYWDEKLYN